MLEIAVDTRSGQISPVLDVGLFYSISSNIKDLMVVRVVTHCKLKKFRNGYGVCLYSVIACNFGI